MVADKRTSFDDDSRGILRSDVVRASRQPEPPVSPITRLSDRRTPADHYSAIRDTPRPVNSDKLSDEEYRYRLRKELQATDRLVKPPKPPADFAPVVHLERGNRTVYLLEKRAHARGGYVEVTYEAFPDGSGRLTTVDTGSVVNPVPFDISFDQLCRAYAAALEKRERSQQTPPEGA